MFIKNGKLVLGNKKWNVKIKNKEEIILFESFYIFKSSIYPLEFDHTPFN